jgi:hypothetical protein
MGEPTIALRRRKFLQSAWMAAAVCVAARARIVIAESALTTSLFDGKTLGGWIQVENSETSFSGNDITDFSALAKSITAKQDVVSAFVNGGLDDTVRTDLSTFATSSGASDKAIRPELAKNLSKIISGPLIYDKARFHGVHLRTKTRKLLHRNPQGRELVELNRMLLVDAFPSELAVVKPGWGVRDGTMASTGAGRGVIYSARDYNRFRLTFSMRHVSGNPDHQACVLIFCTRPSPNETPLDALGGIQFQVPKGGHWDYRVGRNDAGGDEFTTLIKPAFDPGAWSRVEIVADASTGRARMAVAQPAGSKAVAVLDFHDPSAGRVGPIAWQMHNAGLFDEYKEVTIEENPDSLDLISTA